MYKLNWLVTKHRSHIVGYKTIAIELFFDHSNRENIKRLGDVFPKPHDLLWLETFFQNKLKILQRITICYADALVTHAMVCLHFIS